MLFFPSQKPTKVIFFLIKDRYLKDLNNDENNMYARRSDSNTSNYETKRKKLRIDYAE